MPSLTSPGRDRSCCALKCLHLFVTLMMASILLLTHKNAVASPGCLSDIDNNQTTDAADLLAVISAWGACPSAPATCAADVVVSGAVDVADLIAVIGNWGVCPCLPQNGCVSATRLWCEDFQLNNYSRWTGGYSASGPCRSSGFATDLFNSSTRSHKSQIFCTNTDSHRGYGGLRFQGDSVLSSFGTNSSGGINAPNGVIVQFWVWLNVSYSFSPTKWMSLMTVTDDCSNNWGGVLTVNLDDSSRRLKPVHVSSVTYASGAPAVPLQQWTRVTIYLNYYTGVMHIWQNGSKVANATFTRPNVTMCQWHWGLYASGNNDNITLYEDDIRIFKLTQPLTNFTVEPVPQVSDGCQ